ncbi:uncharacterized protein E0L32_003417 [Thyridium curvatum]|uniref:DUF1446-domain-containing protein n=1 Tax=Thyridium curvatum TaxID=1093900 RepID=A0A507B189_9PEZI|nr:uncharacterized protein E0L32_003417 [Thyridium curvatum]TPX16855.1 hypothetical protein E0L32_003417 [Thyridium curvatum]
MARRPIRIGNCSGAINDGLDQLYAHAKSGQVDAITADYLAEFNLAWRAIDLQTKPEAGYEGNFLEQLAYHNGDAARLLAKNKIKVVHDGGALNPKGLAVAADKYFKSLGIKDVRVAWVDGDNVTEQVRKEQFGPLRHLDYENEFLTEAHVKTMLTANAYTGQAGVVRALKEGADIVICGRCCDASPVMGLASWWHGWGPEDYDQLAGGLMAGHLIECGPYVTGGNYCGAPEIKNVLRPGFPIAEISADGTVIVTKTEGTNGAVTIDTCKGQLVYEIQGDRYLNPDVIAHIENMKLEEVGKDRVKLTGVTGSAPPPTTKLAVCLLGGWQAEICTFCAGLDTDFKFEQMREGVLSRLKLEQFSHVSVERYGTSPANPKNQADCTVMIRIFAQAPQKEHLTQLKQAVFYNGMTGYAGLTVAMDWRTLEPKMYVKYFPALVPQTRVPLTVHMLDTGIQFLVEPRPAQLCAPAAPKQRSFEPRALAQSGRTVRRALGDLAFARSGDKGGNANVGFWVREASAWPWLQSYLTSRKLTELLGEDWRDKYEIVRCEFPELWAVHFVIKGILQEGVSSSSLIDGFGKSFGEYLRARHVDMPAELLESEQKRRKENMAKAGRSAARL